MTAAGSDLLDQRLRIVRCSACGEAWRDRSDDIREWCRSCGATDHERASVPAIGQVLCGTTVHVAVGPTPTPFSVVGIQLADGILSFAQLPADSRWRTDVGPDDWVSVDVGTDPPVGRRLDDDDVAAGLGAEVDRARREAIARVASMARPAGQQFDDIQIAGVGMTPFGKHPETSQSALATRATMAAVRDAGVGVTEIDAVFASSAFGGPGVAQGLAARLPLAGRPLFNVENACAGGTSALLQAAMWVHSGAGDVALAVGVDAMGTRGGLVPLEGDHDFLRALAPLPAIYAMAGDAYLDRNGYHEDDLDAVVIKSRRHAHNNPLAAQRSPVTRQQVREARQIADPLRLLHCCPNADGAAAVIVMSAAEAARRGVRPDPVRLLAGVTVSGLQREKVASEGVAGLAAARAYELSGRGPDDIDVVEVHDSFAPAEPMALEALRLAAPGEALGMITAGRFSHGDTTVSNPSGGLLSRGHPPAATGLAQVHDIVTQLRGEHGANGMQTGLVHNQGGSVLDLDTNACSVFVLGR